MERDGQAEQMVEAYATLSLGEGEEEIGTKGDLGTGAAAAAAGDAGASHDREGALMGLPVELWYRTFEFLQAGDALRLMLVCWAWHDLVCSQGSWVWAGWYRKQFPHSTAKPRTPARWRNLYLLRLREERIKAEEARLQKKEALDEEAYPIRVYHKPSYVG